MKSLKLTGRLGLHVLVDDEDFDWLSGCSWGVKKSNGGYYAVLSNHPDVLMHRYILGCSKGDGKAVDHRNGDTLDNRRDNLRLANRGQNQWNSRTPKNNSTGYKGVWHGRNGRFRAAIKINDKTRHLGSYATAELAARAYDSAAKILHGEFARINFPDTAASFST